VKSTGDPALGLAPILAQVSRANDNGGVSDLLLRVSVHLCKNDRSEYIAEVFKKLKIVRSGESRQNYGSENRPEFALCGHLTHMINLVYLDALGPCGNL